MIAAALRIGAIPHPWEAIVLVMAAYRWTRLGGWDDWPPIVKIRARILGETWVPARPPGEAPSAVDQAPLEPALPGKTPESEAGWVRPAYARPTLAHLFHCPFCLGWWISLATYAAWLVEPRWTLYAAAPFALSGAVGLIAKNLDP